MIKPIAPSHPGPGTATAFALTDTLADFSREEIEHGLVGLLPVLDIVKTVIYSGQVKGERAVSAVLVAPVGSGKTVCIERTTCEVAPFTSDFTAREASPIIRRNGTTHIMIGDFLSILGHKAGTVAHSLNILAKLTGDSVTSDPFTGQGLDRPKSMGVISGIPPDELKKKKISELFFAGGFASRFLIVRYHYSDETLKRIHRFIKSDLYTKAKSLKFDVETGAYEINIPERIADKVEVLRRLIKNDNTGMRAHHHLRALIKARARMHGRNEVNESDYEFITYVSDFFCDKGKIL